MDAKIEEVEKEPAYEVYKLEGAITCDKENHNFDYVSGTQVECKKCKVGFGASPNMRIEEGHIYIGDVFVI